MKNLLWTILLTGVLALNIFAQCERPPTPAATGRILKELKIAAAGRTPASAAAADAELSLSIKASVTGASWRKSNAEAAVLTIFVDGKYNQDAVLFAGEQVFEYRMLLGEFGAGEHLIAIALNEKHSAPGARDVRIESAAVSRAENLIADAEADNRSLTAYLARINAPIIFLRPDTIDRFSDLPLLTYYEIFDEPEKIKRIRYTTVFTNEDGGTQSAALMARWGRMTDIEWVYEMRVRESGARVSEIYQAANHETRRFDGARLGSHPLVLNATVNNNFADAGCSSLRVSPLLVEANLTSGSRETVMDANSWTYRIMAEEAYREGRVNAAKLAANTIADPRDYWYAEIYSELENAAIAVEAAAPDGQISSSDQTTRRLRVNRTGYVRIALHLPSAFWAAMPRALAVRCYAVSAGQTGSCRNVNLLKIVRLDQNYSPREIKLESAPQTVEPGAAARFSVPRAFRKMR